MYSLTCLFRGYIANDRKHPAIHNNMASSREEWCTREHDKDGFLSFNEDKKIQTFHGYSNRQTGYVEEPEACSTANIVNKVSVLVFQSIDCYLLSEMCLHRMSGVRGKKESIYGYSSQ